MPLTFDPLFAADPNNPEMIASNAAITIFDPADSGMAPITITDVTGSPLSNPITVNKNGFGPAFQHATLDRVAWSGAGFTGYFTSYEGMKTVAVDAADAAALAQSAAETAGADAAAVAEAALAGAVADAEAAQAAATAAAGLVGAPADAAIAAAVTTPASATATALAATFVPKGTRRAAFAWGCGGSYGATPTVAKNLNPRLTVRLPVATTRWRLKIANYDFMRGVAGGVGHFLRGVWIGQHLTNDGDGTGHFTATGTVAVTDGNAPVPADGTHYATPWVTATDAQIVADTEHIVSFDVTAAADVDTFRTNTGSFIYFGIGQGATAAPVVSAFGNSFFDVHIEYEFVDDGTHPVGLHVGDSITEGQSSGAGSSLRSWPNQYSAMTGAAAINLGCSGVQTNYFNLPTHRLWTKFDITAFAPDYAFVTLGTNDATGSVTLADFKSRTVQILAILRDYGVKRIYLGMIPPRTGLTAGNAQDLLRKSYRDWVATLPAGVHGVADFDTILRDPANTLQMRPDWTVDGIHPIVAGYSRMAKEAGSLHINPRA